MTDDTNEPPKITSVEKTKDPRRVAAGKRLAEISKAAKEKKMRERIESEAVNSGPQTCGNTGWGFLGVIVGLLGVVVSAYSLYYRMKHDNSPPKAPEDSSASTVRANSGPASPDRGGGPQHVVTTKPRLDNFDE